MWVYLVIEDADHHNSVHTVFSTEEQANVVAQQNNTDENYHYNVHYYVEKRWVF